MEVVWIVVLNKNAKIIYLYKWSHVEKNKKGKNKPRAKVKVKPQADINKIWHKISVFLIFAFIFVLNNNKIESNDTFWGLKMGQWMVENKKLITEELFAASILGKPFVAYQWLSQVIFYYISDINGIMLSITKMLAMLIGSFCIGKYFAKKYWNGALTYTILMSASFLTAFRAQVRAHLFGLWFSAILIYFLEKWRENPKFKVFIIPLILQVFWANTHGSFFLAPCLVLFFACSMLAGQLFKFFPEDRRNVLPFNHTKQLFFFACALFLVSFINPFGFALLKKSILMFFTHNYMREYIREWHSIINLPPGNWYILWFSWMFFAFFAFIKARKRLVLRDVLVLALAFIFPFTGVRYVTFSAILSLPLLLNYSNIIWPTGFSPKKMVLIFLPITLLIGYLGYPQSYEEFRKVGFGFAYKNVPLDIVQHIKANKYKGVIMNHYNDGAYIIYYNYPEVKTLMDSRTEAYGQKLYEEQRKAYIDYNAFKRYVTKYNASLVMVRISNRVLRNFLFNDPDWILEKTGMNHDLFRKEGTNDTAFRKIFDIYQQ